MKHPELPGGTPAPETTKWIKKIPPLESVTLHNGTLIQNISTTQSARLVIRTPINNKPEEKGMNDGSSK